MYSQTTTSIFAPNTDKHENISHKNSHGIQEEIGDALHEASDGLAACHAGGIHLPKIAGRLGVAALIVGEVLHNSSTEDIVCKAGVALAKEVIVVGAAAKIGGAAGIAAGVPNPAAGVAVGAVAGIGAYKLVNQALEPVQQLAEKVCHDAFALGRQQLTAFWNNALFNAALTGDLNGVKQALDNGAEINAKNPGWYGHSATQHAVEGGHFQLVIELIKRGANVHQPNIQGNSAVDSARILKNHPAIKEVNDYFELQQKYLFNKALTGDLAGVLEALKHGALINVPNIGYHNHSAVQHAVEGGHFQLVIELIKRGTNVHQPNIQGNSAVDSARILKNHPAIKGVHDYFELQQKYLFNKALTGDLAGVLEALKHGALINAPNIGYHNHSAVQHAVEGGHFQLVIELIKRGANVHQPNIQGNSAVDSARILKNHPAIKGVHDYFELQQKYLFNKALTGDLAGVLEALKHGALINAPNIGYHNHSAVQHAVEGGHSELVIELIKRGANVHQPNNQGNSAVDSARILQKANPKIKVIHDYFAANFKQPAKNSPSKDRLGLSVAQRRHLAQQNVARKAAKKAAKKARRDAKIIREFVQGYAYPYYFENKNNPQALARLYYKVKHGFDIYPPGLGDALPNGSPSQGGMFADRDRAAKGLSTASSAARYEPCYGYSDLVGEIAREKAQEANNNKGLEIEIGGQWRVFHNGKQLDDGREFREFQGCIGGAFASELSARGMR